MVGWNCAGLCRLSDSEGFGRVGCTVGGATRTGMPLCWYASEACCPAGWSWPLPGLSLSQWGLERLLGARSIG